MPVVMIETMHFTLTKTKKALLNMCIFNAQSLNVQLIEEFISPFY